MVWYITVSDDITRGPSVETRQDLLRELDRIEEQRNQEYAAISDAHYRMIDARRQATANPVRNEIPPSQPRVGSVEWFKSRPPVQAVLLVGALAAAIGAVIGLAKTIW
jgi:anti-sigma factor RsiW